MFRFLPWKLIVRRAARAYGIADPALWLARIRKFSQPSEVQEPIELLRAGIHFHARGLINTKAIQHNLDWVWPYWVERQFDPADDSFLPRAFSFSHINLTHRNWTAVGLPELSLSPIVDPRGLVTPLYDGWSLDFWLTDADGHQLVPSRVKDDHCKQSLTNGNELAIETITSESELHLRTVTEVVVEDNQPVLKVSVTATSVGGGNLAMGIRPYNPEGIQFIDVVESLPDAIGWLVNGATKVLTDRSADRLLTSHYDEGDVVSQINDADSIVSSAAVPVTEFCDQGMATAASVFHFDGDKLALTVRVPLQGELKAQGNPAQFAPSVTWGDIHAEVATLSVPNVRIQNLYDSAVKTLVVLSVDDIVPGPYTYRRFWFRDACLMMNPLMSIGLIERCERMLQKFPERQQRNGYFRSQDGEWDSNGQVLWVLNRFRKITHRPLSKPLMKTLDKAVQWIDRKRVAGDENLRHSGLLPAGFSAEHLGPNDFYYWDDFWAEAGARAAAEIWREAGDDSKASRASTLADNLHAAIYRSLSDLPKSKTLGGVPASPYRRLDSGAIGSLVADYPLQLTSPNDQRITATVEAILKNHFFRGGFFQDMIHSGINAYLTLDVAQTLLRNGDDRYRDLMDTVAELASPTGQWPEAIHPRTLGGCMGDGQHGWAAGEWVMMIRNCFVREEHDRLIIGSGLFREWFSQDTDIVFGPTHTPWGQISVRIITPQSNPMVIIDDHWHASAPQIDVRVPGFQPMENVKLGSAKPLQRLVPDGLPIDESEFISTSDG
ncbi:glycoside hydrolase family 15 protein [Rubripirellula reticaptiva]|uniref:Bacterial alpha-L-rhamnosidase n=1 Tax=Rubripirellula reticaptiva TaxID=2528013 RepID=A0A5C6ECW6_9BACT|nr:hypothetical protein [Rubripirellula reticaptiva]TWU46862.1 hypothetical protein Poly59_58350 [Rubripirellula reticaptiva]